MRIALVDPRRTTRLIVTRLLEARGHDVLPFAEELEALTTLNADLSIEALIISAELASMSGVELCWEMLDLIRSTTYPPVAQYIIS
jgi:PleD family two-component response regulator